MKEFTINIKETLEKKVTVEAETLDEAFGRSRETGRTATTSSMPTALPESSLKLGKKKPDIQKASARFAGVTQDLFDEWRS